MNLYQYYNKPESLNHFDEAQDTIPSIVWGKYYIPRYYDADENTTKRANAGVNELKKYRHLFVHTAKDALKFADKIIKGRFPEGEDAIVKANDPFMVFSYALAIGARFLKGEKILARDEYYAGLYFEFLKEEGIPYKTFLDTLRAEGFK